MPDFLGYCRLCLGGDDLNRYLGRYPDLGVGFRSGCFTVHRNLPMGFGASLVAVPSFSPGQLVLHVPFDQIKGDRTGGMAGMVANMFWGWIRDSVHKTLTDMLVGWGMSRDTVQVDQARGPDGGKVGRIVFSQDHINRWLARRPLPAGVRLAIHSLNASSNSLDFVMAVWRD